MTAVWVVLGGMLGAPARYLLDRVVTAYTDSRLPLGTLAVNIVGSALLGVLIGSGASDAVVAAAGIGFCGAFTTFSTFGYETVALATGGAAGQAFGNIVLNTGICLGAVSLGATAAGPFG
ncbi:fluoride efflux transporter CrcB [Nocardia flavorosea]|uniref:Fluoride-specific ion channel FluC n=1 Tax=Nocardia flavorosea TaxID=53429 RepID=A0A846Y6P3_9NOCA|nr:fluoride efflux transporter CrcB [Nocardia flavorosea]